MKTFRLSHCRAVAFRAAFWSLLLWGHQAQADPLLSSWFTSGSTKYARIYTSTANRSNGVSTTTWTGQLSPTYAGVHEINYSSNWVYIKNTGLAPYIMGPWNNPNLPKNQGTSTNVYRFPRIPNVVSNLSTIGRTLTGQGSIGFLVDGVAMYNTSDGFSYSFINLKDAAPNAGIGSGDGVWNRDAWPNEKISFDYALNHPQPSGQYHAHANPIGVRYVLGDNIIYDANSKLYYENTNTTNFQHSPIIGWVNDGMPIYGPYGYSDPTNAASAVRRIISGYVLRDGSYGTTNLNTTGRKSLPVWAQQAQNKTTLSTNQYGPIVSTTYELGHYAEDYDYLGDLGYTQGSNYSTTNGVTILFDLNKYNARYCVTPEYPNGTWAYFATITANGTPWYPYNVGRWYMATPPAYNTGPPPTPGNATTVAVMNSNTPLIHYFKGGTNTAETWGSNPITVAGNTVTLVWNAVEGGTYAVKASGNLNDTNWAALTPTLTATSNVAAYQESDSLSATNRFYKINRTGMASYDANGY